MIGTYHNAKNRFASVSDLGADRRRGLLDDISTVDVQTMIPRHKPKERNMIAKGSTLRQNRLYFSLLGTNTKLEKENGKAYKLAGLSLAPASQSGHNVCGGSTAACRDACVLWYSGRTVMKGVRQAMLRRTRLFFDDQQAFYATLTKDLDKLVAAAEKEGLQPVCRLNVASDLDWSRFIARYGTRVLFYDYTKIRQRMAKYLAGDLPPNYHLTYSLNEHPESLAFACDVLARRGNVAAVFATKYLPSHHIIDPLPKAYILGGKRYKVVDGDKRDVRLPETDGRGRIIGLHFKGGQERKLHAIELGFCLPV